MTPRRLAELTKSLHGNGHESIVVTTDRPPRYPIDEGSDHDLPTACEIHRIPARPGHKPSGQNSDSAASTSETRRSSATLEATISSTSP